MKAAIILTALSLFSIAYGKEDKPIEYIGSSFYDVQIKLGRYHSPYGRANFEAYAEAQYTEKTKDGDQFTISFFRNDKDIVEAVSIEVIHYDWEESKRPKAFWTKPREAVPSEPFEGFLKAIAGAHKWEELPKSMAPFTFRRSDGKVIMREEAEVDKNGKIERAKVTWCTREFAIEMGWVKGEKRSKY